MPHIAFLHRMRRLFGDAAPPIESIAADFADRRLRQPAHPMSDQELARAIRALHSDPASRAVFKEPADGLAAAKPDRSS